MEYTAETTFTLDPDELAEAMRDTLYTMVEEMVEDMKFSIIDTAEQTARDIIEEESVSYDSLGELRNEVQSLERRAATTGDVEDVAYDLDELKREVSSLMFKVDSARRDLDGLADTIDEEPDSETLRWQTIGVLGMIDHALRNSPDPAPAPSADLPPNVW